MWYAGLPARLWGGETRDASVGDPEGYLGPIYGLN